MPPNPVQYLGGCYGPSLKHSLIHQVNILTCCYIEENGQGEYWQGEQRWGNKKCPEQWCSMQYPLTPCDYLNLNELK